MYSLTRTRSPHQIFNVFFYPDAPSALDFLCISMYLLLCILLPGRALRTRFFMYSNVFILMYSLTRTRLPRQIFNVLFYPDAPSAPDLNCILLPGRAFRTGFFMYSCAFILMYSFTRTRHPHQICYVFLCINSYVFLRILMYSYVLCIL